MTTAAIHIVVRQLHKHRLPLVAVYAAAVATYLVLIQTTSSLADRAAAPSRTRRHVHQAAWVALMGCLLADLAAL